MPPPRPSASVNLKRFLKEKEDRQVLTRHRFEAYLDKVFGFSDLVSALPEGRQFPQHPWKKVFDAVFLGAAMQIPSLLQIEAECHDGALAKRIGPISDDTLGYALERQSPEPVFALSCEIARRLKRNGVLRSDWSRGLVVGAVDGIEICSSFARCCDACMEREVQHKVNGEMQTDIQYYHRIVVVVLVSTRFPHPLGCPLSEERRRRGRPARWLCSKIWSSSWAAASWMCWWGTLCICKRPSSRKWNVWVWFGPSP